MGDLIRMPRQPVQRFDNWIRGLQECGARYRRAIEFPERGSIGCCDRPASPRSHSRGVAVDCYKHPLRPQCDAIATWLTPAR